MLPRCSSLHVLRAISAAAAVIVTLSLHPTSASAVSSRILFTDQGTTVNSYLGRSVASAGHFNGDGRPDVVAGSYGYSAQNGRVLIYSGADLAAPPIQILGAGAEDLGYSVAPAGDFNGDGYDDVIVGAHTNDTGGANNGRAMI